MEGKAPCECPCDESISTSDTSTISLGSKDSCPKEPVKYITPVKCVKSMSDMNTWLKSEAYYDLIGFINGISVAVQGKRCSSYMYVSDTMTRFLLLFEKLNNLIIETPPICQANRFGNQAYKIWHKKMEDNSIKFLLEATSLKYATAISEVAIYFTESFGNATRIDYGTGHELSFVMLLCCMFKIGVFEEKDNVACALKLFNEYLIFVRRLQQAYRMEPAGSHGVWSLDDYQFIPFIWGSAQLCYNTPFDPSKFLDEPIIEEYKNDYMFMSCIHYISEVKTGHFAEHSNQLWSISAVQSWIKINSGLVKMYQKEILSKFPVIQHVHFGSLMVFKPVKPGTTLFNVRLGMLPPPTPEKAVTNECGDNN